VPRILVVDDDEHIRLLVQRVLAENGYEVITAASGVVVTQLLAQQPGLFDLFVLDVQMPDMSGTELARRIRQVKPDAKLLYITGAPDHLFADSTVPYEAFIAKPLSAASLLRAVRLLAGTTPDASS